MSERKWVVNASPLILLANIDRLPFLKELCTEMIVPAAVAREIHAGPERDPAQRWLEGEAQTCICRLESIDPVVAAWDLGAGESAV